MALEQDSMKCISGQRNQRGTSPLQAQAPFTKLGGVAEAPFPFSTPLSHITPVVKGGDSYLYPLSHCTHVVKGVGMLIDIGEGYRD